MIKVRHTSQSELELSGTEDELFTLSKTIQQFIQKQQTTIEFKTNINFDPSPYEERLFKIVIVLSSFENIVDVKDKKLYLIGNKEFLNCFADNLPYDTDELDSDVDYHIHFDKVSFSDILSEHSSEIVLTKETKIYNKNKVSKTNP